MTNSNCCFNFSCVLKHINQFYDFMSKKINVIYCYGYCHICNLQKSKYELLLKNNNSAFKSRINTFKDKIFRH